MTPRERHIVRHALGLDRKPKPYRNNFVAEWGTVDCHVLIDMVAKGWATERRYSMTREMSVFQITDAGKAALRSALGEKP